MAQVYVVDCCTRAYRTIAEAQMHVCVGGAGVTDTVPNTVTGVETQTPLRKTQLLRENNKRATHLRASRARAHACNSVTASVLDIVSKQCNIDIPAHTRGR